MYSKKPCKASELEILFLSISVNSGNSLRLDYSRRVLAQLCALRTHDVRALFSLERLSSAALFQETMVCSLGKKKKKNPAQNAIPPLLHPHLCWMQHAGLWHSSRHTHRCEASWTKHHISLEPELPLHCNSVCLLLSFLFFIRRWVSVMKGSVLIQDEEITCCTLKDY